MAGPYRKPQADIYTVLLALALAAVIVATIFAYLETADYGDNKYKGAPRVGQLAPANTAPCQIACCVPSFVDRVGWKPYELL